MNNTRRVVLIGLLAWAACAAVVAQQQAPVMDSPPLETMFPTRQLLCRGSQDGLRVEAPDFSAEERALMSATGSKRADVRTIVMYFYPRDRKSVV